MIRTEPSKNLRRAFVGGFLLLAALLAHEHLVLLAGLAGLLSLVFWWLTDECYEIRYVEDRYVIRHRRRFRKRIWEAELPPEPVPLVSEFVAGFGRRGHAFTVVFSSDAGPLRFNFFADRRRVEQWLSHVTADAARGAEVVQLAFP